MKTTLRYGSGGNALMLAVLMIVFGLAGCEKEGSDKAGKKVERTTENTAPTASGQTDRPAGKMQGIQKEPANPTIQNIKEQPVVPSTESTGGYIDDEEITEQVKEALSNDPMLSESRIEVTTTQGVVKLNGTVDSEQSMNKARELAASRQGVKSVQTDISISVTTPGK